MGSFSLNLGIRPDRTLDFIRTAPRVLTFCTSLTFLFLPWAALESHGIVFMCSFHLAQKKIIQMTFCQWFKLISQIIFSVSARIFFECLGLWISDSLWKPPPKMLNVVSNAESPLGFLILILIGIFLKRNMRRHYFSNGVQGPSRDQTGPTVKKYLLKTPSPPPLELPCFARILHFNLG